MFESDLTLLEGSKIIDYINDNGINHYIEIGVFKGGTFRRVLEHTNAFCEGVDLFEDFIPSDENTHISGTIKMEDLQKALELYTYDINRFRLYKTTSDKFFKDRMKSILLNQYQNKGKLLVFVDANHTLYQCMKDYLYSINLINNGYLFIHNASNTFEPDTWYIAKDGGPYKVVEILKDCELGLPIKYEGTFDRMAIFKVQK